jgi:hypothetical protein
MKIDIRIAELRKLAADCAATKQAVINLEIAVKGAQKDLILKQVELRKLTQDLQDAVRQDAKAVVAKLKAEARARLLGIAVEALDKV